MSNEVSKEVRTVYVTKDYQSFKELSGNRPLTESHVNSIKKSIEDNGSWLSDDPVVVNENMEVIDGQHRLEAHKQLGMSIYYIIVEGADVKRAHAMNRARRNWTLVDWMNSYVKSGNINYMRFLKLYDENEQFGPAVIIAACAEKPLSGSLSRKFRDGELSLSEAEQERAQKRLDMLAELAEIAPNFILGVAQKFTLQVFTHPKYDHARMVKKMQDQGGDTFIPSVYIGTVLAQLERCYNRGTDLTNMIRFL